MRLSGGQEAGTADFGSTSFVILTFTSFPLTYRIRTLQDEALLPHITNELLMWIDWNLDADFSDANELVCASGPLGITTYMTDIMVPVDAKLGLARLRIRLHDTSFGPNATPCGYSNLGEVEDYLIRVVEPKTGLED